MEEGQVVEEKLIDFAPEKLSVVGINEVRPNPWNPKDEDTEEFERVVKSIQRNGLKLPIVVRETGQTDIPYEIIDGEQRWRACKKENYEKVIIYNEGQMSDERAKELTIWYQQQVPFNEVKLAHLIAELTKIKDFSTPYSDEKMAELLELSKFDPEDFKETEFEGNPDDDVITFSTPVTREQMEVIQQALNKCMDSVEQEISKGRALELISADYLANG